MTGQQTRQDKKVALLSLDEVAKELDVSKTTVRRLVDAGLIRVVDLSRPGARRRTLKVNPAELERLLRDGIPKDDT